MDEHCLEPLWCQSVSKTLHEILIFILIGWDTLCGVCSTYEVQYWVSKRWRAFYGLSPYVNRILCWTSSVGFFNPGWSQSYGCIVYMTASVCLGLNWHVLCGALQPVSFMSFTSVVVSRSCSEVSLVLLVCCTPVMRLVFLTPAFRSFSSVVPGLGNIFTGRGRALRACRWNPGFNF